MARPNASDTTYRINVADLFTLGVSEDQHHRFTAEASTLGFPVGQFPHKIETDMGNGMPFLLANVEHQYEELVCVDYNQANGCISLRIWND